MDNEYIVKVYYQNFIKIATKNTPEYVMVHAHGVFLYIDKYKRR